MNHLLYGFGTACIICYFGVFFLPKIGQGPFDQYFILCFGVVIIGIARALSILEKK